MATADESSYGLTDTSGNQHLEKPYGHSNPFWIVLFLVLHISITWTVIALVPDFFGGYLQLSAYFLLLGLIVFLIRRKKLDTTVYFDNPNAEPDLEKFVKYVDEKYYVPFEVAFRNLPRYLRRIHPRFASVKSRGSSRLVKAQTQSRLVGAGILLFVLWLLLMAIDVVWASIWLSGGEGLDRLFIDPVLWFKNGSVVCGLAVYLYGSGGLVRLVEALWKARDPSHEKARGEKDETKKDDEEEVIKFIEEYEMYLKAAYNWRQHISVGWAVMLLVVVSMQITHWYGIEAEVLYSFPTMLFGFLLGFLLSLYYRIARTMNSIWGLPRSESVRALYHYSKIGQRAQKFCLMMIVLVVFYSQTAIAGFIGVVTDPNLDQSPLFSAGTLIWIVFGIIFTLFFIGSVSYGAFRRIELWKDEKKSDRYLDFERTLDLGEAGKDTVEELRSAVEMIGEITSWPGTLKSLLYAIAVIVVSTVIQILAWLIASVEV